MSVSSFCSRVSQAEEGVFPGTGVRGEIYVFLPVEKRFWGSSELNTAWAAPEQLDAIRQARRGGVVTRLYNPTADQPARSILAHPSPGASDGSLDMLDRLVEALAAQGWRYEPEPGPRLYLCTQGTRDRCCAKWGFAVYREAARLWREGRFPFEPQECSHLGGDRYAATGVMFPSGAMYGHLDRVDLEALGRTEAGDGIYPGHYRGRVFEGELAQIVRAGLARDGHPVTATSPMRVLDPQTAPGTLTVDAGPLRFEVSLDQVESAFYGSCKALAHERVSHTHRTVYAGARRLQD